MRAATLLRCGILLTALVSPSLVRAQFQQPTDEELKMTADPKAPGAAAVYLNVEEITDDTKDLHSFYQRIKILTEKGKDLATVRISYILGVEKVEEIQGRTIHADGAVIPLTAMPENLMDFKANDLQVNVVVFSLPSVEVGSILEYRLRFRTPDNQVSSPTWDIQKDYFVHKAHYRFHHDLTGLSSVTNSKGEALHHLLYSVRLPEGVKVNADKDRNLFTLDLTDVPPAPSEDWMPPLNAVSWRVEFYYTNADSGADFWKDAGQHWATEAQEFASPSAGLKKAVAGIVAPTDSEEQKARKIYTAVHKIDNTDFSRRKSESERSQENLKDIHKAEDVWKQQSGSADEIALLYVALARAAGLKAFPVQVVDRDRALFDFRYLSLSQLDDYLAVVDIGGKDVYLDPGQKMCPFAALHWKHSYASGLRLTNKGAVPTTTPGSTSDSQAVRRFADLTIDANGAVQGTVRFVMSGPDALYWRQMALEFDRDGVKKRFNDSIKDIIPDGVRADFDHFIALEDEQADLMGIVKVSGNIGIFTRKLFILPGLFFESHAEHTFAMQGQRLTPIDLHYARIEEDDVTYTLPSSFTVVSVPQPITAAWPRHATLSISSLRGANSVEVERTLNDNFTLLDPKDYTDLHDFYRKVATGDQQQVVLSATPGATEGAN